MLALAAAAASAAPSTEEIFSRYGDRVVRIEVSEIGASAKSSVGSAFVVAPAGILMTNFHVVSRLVHDPDRFAAVWSDGGAEGGAVEVLAIDVVHDLAVVQAAGEWSVPPLVPTRAEIAQGRRLWSFGYPLDIGKSIVEGTYNGPMERSLVRRLHFTGSLNPGMSGGPVVTEEGEVVGVNVAGAGEQVSFLVPASAAIDLLETARSTAFAPREDLQEDVRAQVFDYQQRYFEELFDAATETVELGPFSVPTKPRAFFDCSGDVSEPDDERWRDWTQHRCATEDFLYISGSHWSGLVRFEHLWLTGSAGGRLRFYETYDNDLGDAGWWHGADEDDVTSFRCQVDHVEHTNVTWNVALCLRAYKKIPGLYDGIVRVSSLLPGADGLQSSISLGGVSFETLRAVSQRFLEKIRWNGP